MEPPRTTKKELVTAFRTSEILAATYRLLGEKGVEAVTMDDIAQAAGVAKGTLYVYFQSKDELLQALLSQVGEGLARKLETIVRAPAPPESKLREVLEMFVAQVEKERILFPLYLRELVRSKAGKPTALTPRLQALEDRIMGLLSGLFAEGMAAGCFMRADPALLAHLLKGLIRALGYYQMAQESAISLKHCLPVVVQLFFGGIVLSPETSPGA